MSRGWGERGSSRAWRNVRQYVLDRDRHRCQLRLHGCTYRATHAHHTVEWFGRPEDVDPALIVAACSSCNLKTGDPAGADPEPRPWVW
jgi:5-methylcytosine-specific restriction endonuclease McrA